MSLLLPVLLASLRAVGSAMTLACAGAYLHRLGIMTAQVSKGLSRVSMTLTIPLLLLTSAIDCAQNTGKSCPSMASHLEQAWVLLLLPLVNVSCGLALGWCSSRFVAPEFRRSAIAAVCFGNSTGLPITLLTCIAAQFGPDTDLGNYDPIVFLSVYLAVYPVLQWSIGTALLQPVEPPTEPLMQPLRGGEGEAANGGAAPATEGALFVSSNLAGMAELPIEDLVTASPPAAAAGKASWRTALARMLPPPALGAIAGMAIALLPGVRNVLVDIDDMDDDAPLEWLFNALLQIGRAAVPLNMMLLGNRLGKSAEAGLFRSPAAPWSEQVAVLVGKMVGMPLVGLGSALALNASGVLKEGPDDAILLVLMVVTVGPTANNISVMAELAGQNRERLSACIFLQYAVAPVLLTAWVTLFTFIAVNND